MRNNTRKRPEEPATPEPGDKTTPRPADSVLPGKNGVDNSSALETPKPPSKKRKLDISPPWKSIMTQTPTSFVVDGRRKSGRTNPIPIELMPSAMNGKNGTPTRQTRSSMLKLEDAKSAKGSAVAAAKTNTRATATATASSSTRRNVSQKLPDRASSTSVSNSKNGKNYSKRSTTPTPSRQSTSQASLAKNLQLKSGSKSKASPVRTPITYTGSRRTSSRTSTRAATEASIGRAIQGSLKGRRIDQLLFDSDGELDVEPDWKPRKIRIRFRRTPPLTITHPLHIPPQPKYESFDAFLDSEEVIQKRSEEELEEEAREEAEIRQRVEAACEDGVLTLERCSAFMPDEQPGPPRQYYHHDQLMAHALNFQKLMERERRLHMGLAKKLAMACAQKVQESIPKTKEEIEEELVREAYKLYREAVVVGIRNKWALITEEVHRRRRERAEELRQLQGKEQLNQMLEHSTQLLKVRARHASILTASEAEEGEDEAEGEGEEGKGSDEGEEGEEEEEDKEDEVNMSSSGSEDEEDIEEDDDANLTVEQLREKYAALRKVDETTKVAEERASPMQASEAGHGTEDEKMEPLNRERGVDPSAVELEEVDDILLDDEDEDSVIMDSELDSQGSAESDDGEEEEEEGENPGLLGFFGDIENLVKQGSLPVAENREATEDVEMVDTDVQDEGEAKVETLLEVKYEDKGTDGTLAVETDITVSDTAPTKSDDAVDNSKALAPYVSLSNDGAEIDDETTASSSPAQNKNSVSTSSHTTPQPAPDIKTPIPFLLRGTLREYQHYGLDWLAGLYSNKTNGILADEMGLGKTIQTIALIAHLACEKEVWGPHLIVVPTSVMLNWEMEFKKWAPGFKILTYYGSREQRAEKRKGWFDDNLWHVCITSYQLVLQDQVTFKRRNWHYLILDEAHNIKNFRSQRWQTLLNFKAEARLLLTGTPLQNNLVELWSLLYFLMPSGASSSMPSGFANLKEFQEWFAHPVDQLIEGGREHMDDEARNTVTKLHQVLRPYLLRRLKADVEKQMPAKYEHIIYCRLSKRQRYLYDDFMSLAKTRETLASGNYLSIINCLMQLRKVCNHPDLFETRQIVTSLAMSRSVVADFEIKDLLVRRKLLQESSLDTLDLGLLNLVPAKNEANMTTHTANSLRRLNDTKSLIRLYNEELTAIDHDISPDFSSIPKNRAFKENLKKLSLVEQLKHCAYLNDLRCNSRPIYGANLREACTVDITPIRTRPLRRVDMTEGYLRESLIIRSMIPTLEERTEEMATIVDKFGCVTPNVVCTDLPPLAITPMGVELVHKARAELRSDPFHAARVRLSIAFPDKRLLQYDCGKLQRLDSLLRELQTGGHRALIFTQMTKVLDILEQFLNIHGHRYLRLDGSTKVEQRQILTERFNNDPRILVFILSTRSGGLGINLTGADTVIFYDLDWNPAMDKQCQDRCHRIGQTRDVHIYRFVSEYTIESNILRKANQKRMLDDVVIQEGDFTTDYFNKLTLKDMLGEDVIKDIVPEGARTGEIVLGRAAAAGVDGGTLGKAEVEKALELAEDVEDVVAAKAAQRELVDVDGADFGEISSTATTKRDRSGSTSKASATATSTPKDVQIMEELSGENEDGTQKGVENGEENEPGHIDEWMVQYIDWEIENLPVLPASKDSKKRRRERSKKAKLYH
ncbi:SNF2 family N-terminal domain-containing protein [Kalaharituber pfeilii]|nr:SNF2 family N-terminal domain-containing protein [Kalaharituber pfeilii]